MQHEKNCFTCQGIWSPNIDLVFTYVPIKELLLIWVP